MSGTRGRPIVAGIGRGGRRKRCGPAPFNLPFLPGRPTLDSGRDVTEVTCSCGCGGEFAVPTADRRGRRCFSGALLFPELERERMTA